MTHCVKGIEELDKLSSILVIVWAGANIQKIFGYSQGTPWIVETKPADRDASEYHLNHCDTEKGGSKTDPNPRQGLLIST